MVKMLELFCGKQKLKTKTKTKEDKLGDEPYLPTLKKLNIKHFGGFKLQILQFNNVHCHLNSKF